MINRRAFLLVAILILVLEVGLLIDKYNHKGHLHELKAIVQKDVDLIGMTDYEKAIAIRERIYNTTPLKHSPPGYNFLDFTGAYQEATTGQVGHICGGLALLYISALESQGIAARYVGIFADSPDTHASVEFWDGSRWIASDPTFNIMFLYEGRYLNWEEIWEVVQAGASVEFVGDQIPERRIETYYISFDQLVRRMVIHPATINERQWPMRIYPPDWIEGREITSYSGIYEILGRGLLR
jgi:hypothetical protein